MHLNEAGRWKNKIHASYPGIFVTLITAAANAEHVKKGKKSDPNPHVPYL